MNKLQIESRKAVVEPITFFTANEEMNVEIKAINMPEMVMEDKSIIFFPDLKVYYDLITYQSASTYIDMDILSSKYYPMESADVVGVKYDNKNIIGVERYICEDDRPKYIYRFIME